MKILFKTMLLIMVLFTCGCAKNDENNLVENQVAEFDKIILELKGAVSKDITNKITDGIYIKKTAVIEQYSLEQISGISFEKKLNLIKNMDINSTHVYIVINNRYILWSNYENIDSFDNAETILDIIGLKTVVYNQITETDIYADGEIINDIGTGLRGYYFSDMNVTNVLFNRVDPVVNFNWENGSPDARVPNDNFSVIWTGSLKIPEDGNYTLYTISDDGIRVWLNGELIIDKWVNQGPTRHNSSLIEGAKAGEKMSIRVEYFENGGGASAILGWVKPGNVDEIIPKINLYPGSSYKVPKINIEYEEIMRKVIIKGSVSHLDNSLSDVTINWGDGSSEIYINNNFEALHEEHIYSSLGKFLITIRARDMEGNKIIKTVSFVSSDIIRKKEKIAFLGDSITQMGYDNPTGYVRLFETDYAALYPEINLEVIGAGIGGNRVADLQGRIEGDVLSKNPTKIVIYIGINDVWNEAALVTEEQFREGLNDIVTRAMQTGRKVILCTPSIIGEKKGGENRLDAKLDLFAEVSRSIAAQKNITLVDLRTIFKNYLELHNINNVESGVLTTDGVHMNTTGDRLIADSILRKIDGEQSTIYTEEAPTNFKYIAKDIAIVENGNTTIQTHRYNFDAPDIYNVNKSRSYPLVISLCASGFPNSVEALTIPMWTFGQLADNSPYCVMPGENQQPAFFYTPICPPPYSREFGGPSAPDGGEWNSPAAKQMIIATIKELISRYNIDTKRIYINGFSMGGAGVWYIAQEFYEKMGYPVAAISRCAGYTPTNQMLDMNKFPDVYRSAIWYHVGEKDTMPLNGNTMGNFELAHYTYNKIKQQRSGGIETVINRSVGNGLTANNDSLESTLYDYSVGGRSVFRLSVYANRGHEDLSARNTDFVNWMYGQKN
jgi:lysophospholipase L1-like esterase